MCIFDRRLLKGWQVGSARDRTLRALCAVSAAATHIPRRARAPRVASYSSAAAVGASARAVDRRAPRSSSRWSHPRHDGHRRGDVNSGRCGALAGCSGQGPAAPAQRASMGTGLAPGGARERARARSARRLQMGIFDRKSFKGWQVGSACDRTLRALCAVSAAAKHIPRRARAPRVASYSSAAAVGAFTRAVDRRAPRSRWPMVASPA